MVTYLLQKYRTTSYLALVSLTQNRIKRLPCAQGKPIQRYFKYSQVFNSLKRLKWYERLNKKRSISEIFTNTDKKRLFSEQLNRQGDIHATISFENITTYPSKYQLQYSFLFLDNFLVSTNYSSLWTSSPFTKKKMFLQYF